MRCEGKPGAVLLGKWSSHPERDLLENDGSSVHLDFTQSGRDTRICSSHFATVRGSQMESEANTDMAAWRKTEILNSC